MRHFLAIFLFSIYLINTTEAYQLLKVPAFIVHFVQHSKDDPEMDLASFIQMHYAEEQVFDADWQQDMELPFKSHEDKSSLAPLCYFPPVQHFPGKTVNYFFVREPQSPLNDFSLDIFTADIFQPPRI